MPFIPHTKDDVAAMLNALSLTDLSQLYDDVPAAIPKADLNQIIEHFPALNEMDIMRVMQARAPHSTPGRVFLGAGAYEHHIPAFIGQLVSRGEFYTAYTPYQAEASQGSLQVLYEYQTMMAELMAMDVSNASLYDGATALAEAILMAVRLNKDEKTPKKIILPRYLHPHYRAVLKTLLSPQGIELMDDNEHQTGVIARVIQQPNFLGQLEAVDELTDEAHAKGLTVIAVVNPLAMAYLKPPGQWGKRGADIVCGEGQPLGVPLSYGGPYFGFFCCRKADVRQMPGRVVARTHDALGRVGYTLTLQTREQHIRRGKATSNICTNQGLMVVAATMYLATLGASGLATIAAGCHDRALHLCERLCQLPGIRRVFTGSFFHEFVLQFDRPIQPLLTQWQAAGLTAGLPLAEFFPDYSNALLICATETKTQQDLDDYVSCVSMSLN